MSQILIRDVMEAGRAPVRRGNNAGVRRRVQSALPLDDFLAMPDADAALAAGLTVCEGIRAVGTLTAPGLARRMSLILRDAVQERDVARLAAVEAKEQRSRLIANLAHELRTPLNAVIGFSDMIAQQVMGPVEPAVYCDHASAILETGEHMLSVVESILSLARISSGELVMHEVDCDVREEMAAALRICRGLAERRHVTLDMASDRRLPRVHLDPQLLRQVIINLVSNAIKASAAGAFVRVSATLNRDRSLRLTVQDEGCGMTADQIEGVMRPYRQLVAERSGFQSGTGLGLPLVKAMVELHDGQFQLMSTIGQGTMAIVTLPSARVRGLRPVGSQGEFEFTRISSELCG